MAASPTPTPSSIFRKKIDGITTFVRWLEQTDGRDKAAKTIQYIARLFAYLLKEEDRNLSNQLSNLMAAVRDGRKLFRFGKGVADAQQIVNAYNNNKLTMSSKVYTIISRVGYFNYWLFDHIVYLARSKVINVPNIADIQLYSAYGWVVAIIFALADDFEQYTALTAQETEVIVKGTRAELQSMRATKTALQLKIVQKLGDLVLSVSLARLPERIFGEPWNESFVSLSGIVAGAIASYTNIKNVRG